MRMWMVDPKILCDKHLLGEHVECHMFVGAINKRKSIAGHTIQNQAEPLALHVRHQQLALEMINRGMEHKSYLPDIEYSNLPRGALLARVNHKAALKDLLTRCQFCKSNYEKITNGSKT